VKTLSAVAFSGGSRIYEREGPRTRRSRRRGRAQYKREDRGVAGAEGVECGEGYPLPIGEEVWGEGDFPLQKFFSILDLKMATLGEFWALYFTGLARRRREVRCGEVFKFLILK